MKASTEELILTQLLTINTEIVKIHSELGYMKQDAKGLWGVVEELKKEMRSEFKAVREEVRLGFEKIDKEFEEVNAKLDWMGEKVFIDHETRISKLEGLATIA